MTTASLFDAPAGESSLYPVLQREQLTEAIQLIRSENVGPVTFYELIRRYQTPAKALEALPHLARKGGRKAIRPCPRDKAEAEIEAVEKLGGRLLVYGEPDYPAQLLRAYDPPPVISVLGNPNWLNRGTPFAMVGARNASTSGCRFARTIASELGQKGMTIISGLARGIDTAAHLGSLETGTVAVIAGGIDTIYPPENKGLYEQITEKGAIISEQPPGSEPLARSFPARNRIIAGMSLGVLVVEASLRSGSLVTARFALQENREVFAVPGSPMDPRCQGTNHLLKQGAILTESAEDIAQALAQQKEHRINDIAPPPLYAVQPAPAEETEQEAENEREKVLQHLSATPIAVDDLVKACHIPANVILTILLELELAGRLERHPGGRVSLLYA